MGRKKDKEGWPGAHGVVFRAILGLTMRLENGQWPGENESFLGLEAWVTVCRAENTGVSQTVMVAKKPMGPKGRQKHKQIILTQ